MRRYVCESSRVFRDTWLVVKVRGKRKRVVGDVSNKWVARRLVRELNRVNK